MKEILAAIYFLSVLGSCCLIGQITKNYRGKVSNWERVAVILIVLLSPLFWAYLIPKELMVFWRYRRGINYKFK